MSKIEKVALTNKAGKTVEFAKGQVDYMLKHGWSKGGQPEAEDKGDSDPVIGTESTDTGSEPSKVGKSGKSGKLGK